MKKLLTALILLASTPAFALLPPLEQSIKEIQTILDSPQLQQLLPSSEEIVSINASQNEYGIRTTNYLLLVKIVSEPQDRPGPAQFRLEFNQPTRVTE